MREFCKRACIGVNKFKSFDLRIVFQVTEEIFTWSWQVDISNTQRSVEKVKYAKTMNKVNVILIFKEGKVYFRTNLNSTQDPIMKEEYESTMSPEVGNPS